MLGVLLAALASGCSGAQDNGQAPVATLGSSIRSERELRPLIMRWTLGIERERQALDGALGQFVERYRNDTASEALVPLAQVYQAFNALSRQELKRAQELAQPALLGPPGATRDLAMLVVGAAERRAGRHQQALDRLEPLLHKMLDTFATSLLNQELVAAALGTKDFAKALRYMEIWRREAEPGNEAAIDDEIATLLEQLPREVLRDELERRRQRGLLEEGVAMATAIARRLARYATEYNDVQLAKLLLRYYSPLLGNTAVAVAKLSAEQTRGRVAARTVGLVMSLDTPWQRRRSVDVAAGLAYGLELPGSQARLVSEPLGKEENAADAALKRLAAQGASVVVGGVDTNSATQLAQAADRAALPVLLLSPAAKSSNSPFVFFLGTSSAETLEHMRAQLSKRGAERIAMVGDDFRLKPRREVVATFSCAALPDATSLRDAAVEGLALLDGSYCFREVTKLARLARLPLAAGLGVTPRDKLRPGQPHLSAGLFPVSDNTPQLRGWWDAGRQAPSWWTGLGRDAGVLAWEAVKELSGRTSDKAQVQALRLQVTAALATARKPLWTSTAQGFDNERRIARLQPADKQP